GTFRHPVLCTKLLGRKRFLAQRRNDAKHCRVSKGVLCAFAALRENDFFPLRLADDLWQTLSTMLRVTEIFRSIQGESTHAGRPCTFVRLTGCPMRCVWCDSEYTFTGGEHFTIDSIMAQVNAFGVNLVEVTGGEPLAQKEAFKLIERLCNDGFEVLVETGNYVSTEGLDPRAKVILDIKCPASGEEPRNEWSNIERLRPDMDEVKFVIADEGDWQYTKRVIKERDLEAHAKAILISPVWGQINLQELADWVSGSGLNVRMQLQLHKYIWGPDVHGV
ncbi:MAG TPA: radical SAM protein, partial [Pyrinomonadaceae bacterium]|nr:radical SAM protein [Pyrinomonadaceae bacterium]